jgi:DNA topoisomerase-3
MKLIIAEKPSVAKSIASALGATSRADGYFEGGGLIVSWCLGHLVCLMDAAGYDERFKKWRYDDLPILPEPFRYVTAPGKEDAFENLRSLMDRPDVDTIVNACDAGREGELIFRLVYDMAGCTKPMERLWVSSMEDAAIREGFENLRPGAEYEALYQSALCRQKADWLVGINATRLFSVLYHRTLNVGRVQTPTLAMLAERDGKITMFQKEKYHHVRLNLNGTEAVSERFTTLEDAQAIQAACRDAVCTAVQKGQKKEQRSVADAHRQVGVAERSL